MIDWREKMRKTPHTIEAQAASFWRKVDICEHGAECDACCWEWKGSRGRYGHGNHTFYGRAAGAIRIAKMLQNNAMILPMGLCVCHACDNPPCCNPSHLWIGTAQDNQMDRTVKGRTNRGKRRVYYNKPGSDLTHYIYVS